MNKNGNIISAEILNNLGVYELRELARNLGVVSPTTKKREELCEQILKISSGEIKTETKRNNKGRPPKAVGKITSFVNDFIPEEILRIQKSPEFFDSNLLTLAQNPSLINCLKNEKSEHIFGFVNSINGHFYIKNTKTYNNLKDFVFYIPTELANKFCLRNGDKIVGSGKLSEINYCGIIENITKINDEEMGAYTSLKSRNNFDLSSFEIPSQKETFLGKEYKKGERLLFFFDSQEDAIVKILEGAENSEDKIILLGVELAPEIIYFIKSKPKIEAFTTSFYNTLEESYETILNAINYSNTLLQDGKSVKLFIFDLSGILTRLDLYFASETSKYLNHSISSIQIIKKLIGSGKSFSKDLQLTTFGIAFTNERDSDFLKTELGKVFSKII